MSLILLSCLIPIALRDLCIQAGNPGLDRRDQSVSLLFPVRNELQDSVISICDNDAPRRIGSCAAASSLDLKIVRVSSYDG